MCAERVPIEFGSKVNVIEYLGSLYRSPSDAVKEYVSNAVDEWHKLKACDASAPPCEVTFEIRTSKITIGYDLPGMSESEFKAALKSVADSAKKGGDVKQIGALGIGLLAFQQFANKCTILSKKNAESPTTKVILRRSSDVAEFERALEREKLKGPGMRITIEGFPASAVGPNGALSRSRLFKIISDKFDAYIRNGNLKVQIIQGETTHLVTAPDITLPGLAAAIRELRVGGSPKKPMKLRFWYDPSGKSKVAIRHQGVVVVDSVADDPWFQDTVFASGEVKGYIDADFLMPLASRTSFEQNQDWFRMLESLEPIQQMIQDDLVRLKSEQLEETKRKAFEKALELAKEILAEEAFRDLVMLSGLSRRTPPTGEQTSKRKPGERTGERSRKPGDQQASLGLRIAYQEEMFPDGVGPHSRFTAGVVVANTLNPDWRAEVQKGSLEQETMYIGLLIAKETLAFNDRTGAANDHLERMLTFLYSIKNKISGPSAVVGARRRGRPRK
jgi:hypothetical protein